MFIDKLITKIKERNNPTVMGLDPVLDYLPATLKEKHFNIHGKNLKGAANALFEFNQQIIDEVYDIVPAVKLQLACYEMYGIEGMITFGKTVQYAKEKGLLVLADGKRNDIGSSAECYSRAFLGRTLVGGTEQPVFDVDALTVNPYLGADGIKPFLADCAKYEKGLFILVKTSNKSSGQLQDLLTEFGKSFYEEVAQLVSEWGRPLLGQFGYSSIGAVVGATYPNQAKVLRNLMKGVFILVPGYGAQGGTARDVVHSFDSAGNGAIVNASRSIMCAVASEAWKGKFKEEEFAKASRHEALRMRDELNEALLNRK